MEVAKIVVARNVAAADAVAYVLFVLFVSAEWVVVRTVEVAGAVALMLRVDFVVVRYCPRYFA